MNMGRLVHLNASHHFKEDLIISHIIIPIIIY